MKFCLTCINFRKDTDFYRISDTYCRKCNKERAREWARNNHERKRLANLNLVKKNRKKYLDTIKRWNKEHPQKKYPSVREWKKKNPEKVRAHKAVAKAVRDGLLTRPDSCEEFRVICRPEGHHEDHSKVLEVKWLCHTCHDKRQPLATKGEEQD